MNKKIRNRAGAAMLSTTLMLGVIMPMPVFAAQAKDTSAISSAVSAAAAEIAKNLVHNQTKQESTEFSSSIIKLSLEDAIARAQKDGVSAATAIANANNDAATADGYKQSLDSVSNALNRYADADLDLSVEAGLEDKGVTQANEKMLKLQSDFARNNLDKNKKADMNQIESDTRAAYYGVIQVRDNLAVCEQTLQLKKDILSNTQKKYQVGTVSKLTLTQAENDVNSASSALETAQAKYDNARRSLNLILGYDLMQSVELTTNITKATMSAIDLNDATNKALANRNEITSVNYSMQLQELHMSSVNSSYSVESSTYKKQQAAYLATQLAVKNVPLQIKDDIRAKVADVLSKSDAVASAQSALSLAQNGYNVALATYNAGASVATDLKSAEIAVQQASLGVTAAIADYNTAVFNYNIAQGEGTKRIEF